jgi:hypothetical protein
VVELIRKGERNRHVSATDYNEHSSRSHTIFQLIIESRDRNGSRSSSTNSPNFSAQRRANGTTAGVQQKGPVRLSTLNLIDLAGSEKANSSLDRRREGAYINKSLLTLGNVISKLTEEKPGHIPYRDSKLTRILQPSLQGDCRVSVVCTISPAAGNQEESTNTLKFAQRVKQVKIRAERKEIMDDKALLQQYRAEIEELRSKLIQLSTRDTESTQLAAEKLRLEEELHQQQLVRIALKERIDHLTKLILTSSSFNTQGWQADAAPAVSATPMDAAAKRKSKRMSFSLTKKMPDLGQLEENLAQKTVDVERMQQQVDSLNTAISEKDTYINQLLEEIHQLRSVAKTPANHDAMIHSLKRELEEVRRRNGELERREKERQATESALVDLDRAVSLTHQKSVDPDKFDELAHELDVANDCIIELQGENQVHKQRIAQLESQLVKHSSASTTAQSRSFTPVSSETPLKPPASLPTPPNLDNLFKKSSSSQSTAERLSNIIRSHSRDQLAGSGAVPQTPATDPVERERMKRQQLARKSSDRMAELETELTIAQAELSVAQLLLTYSPSQRRSSSGMKDDESRETSPGRQEKQ